MDAEAGTGPPQGPRAGARWTRGPKSLDAALGVAILGAIALRAATLTLMPLVDTDDSRYAEVGRQMVSLGDWVTPHLSPSRAFWGKPPLHFWATAASIELLGPTDLAARLPSFLGGLAVLAATFLVARRTLGRRAALVACLVLASTAEFYGAWATCLTDMTLTACNTLTLAVFLCALSSPPRSREEGRWHALFFAGLGLGLLAKGPVAAIFAAGALGLFSLFTRDWSWVRRVHWLRGALIALGVAAPWYLLAERRTPGFLRYFIVNENVLRFLSHEYGDLYGVGHAHPRGAIVVMLLLAAIPWTPALALCAFSRARGWRPLAGESRTLAFLAAWALAPLLLFAASRNIVITYVLPSLPPLAILTGHFVVRLLARDEPGRAEAAASPTLRAFEWGGYVSLLAFAIRAALDLDERGVPTIELAASALVLASLAVLLRFLAHSRALAPLLIATGLLLPLADTAIRGMVADELGGYVSTEEIAQFVQRSPALRRCSLVSVGTVQFSTLYHTGGAVQAVSEMPPDLVDRADRASCQLFLVKHKYLERIPPESLARLRLVRDFGGYALYDNARPRPG